jgi:hypothetical protein
VLVREDRNIHETVRGQGEEVERVKLLAEEFATRVPELKFYTFFWNTGNHWGKLLIILSGTI